MAAGIKVAGVAEWCSSSFVNCRRQFDSDLRPQGWRVYDGIRKECRAMITMTRVMWQGKLPWQWLAFKVRKFDHRVFCSGQRVPGNHWLHRPRFFAWVNLGLLSFWRNNSELWFGIGLGKHHVGLLWHHS